MMIQLINFIKWLLITPVFAQRGGTGVTLPNPLTTTDIQLIIERFIGFFIGLSAAVAVAIIIYAGYLFMFSGGDPKKVETARAAILYTVVGYGIIIFAWGLISLLKAILGD